MTSQIQTKAVTETDTAIDVVDLSCSYGDFEAVRGINLSIARGELYALLGTNGAGKTTTMETLEGHRAANGGSVSVLGFDPVADRSDLRPRVGMMLQESGFANDLTVEETIRMWLQLSSSPRAASSVRESTMAAVLKRVDLSDRATSRVVQLSGGQKRRLDLALAIVNEPEVLFLDEPTTGLDPESRQRTWEIIRELRRGGTTIVMTTHYLEEAEQLADRLAIMHAGRIAVEGTLSEMMLEQPTRVSFRRPAGVDGADMERELRTALDPRAMRWDESSTVRLEVDDAHVSLRRLIGWADSHGHRLDELAVTGASLNEIFSRISGSDSTQENS